MIDGALEAEKGLSDIPATNEAAIRIGEGIDGLIDELQILSVALSEEEIKDDLSFGVIFIKSSGTRDWSKHWSPPMLQM